MTMIGTIEAKAQLPRLIECAEAGEQIVITRHGNPVAKIVPVRKKSHADIETQLAAWKKHQAIMRRRGKATTAKKIKRWINEGRA